MEEEKDMKKRLKMNRVLLKDSKEKEKGYDRVKIAYEVISIINDKKVIKDDWEKIKKFIDFVYERINSKSTFEYEEEMLLELDPVFYTIFRN